MSLKKEIKPYIYIYIYIWKDDVHKYLLNLIKFATDEIDENKNIEKLCCASILNREIQY